MAQTEKDVFTHCLRGEKKLHTDANNQRNGQGGDLAGAMASRKWEANKAVL